MPCAVKWDVVVDEQADEKDEKDEKEDGKAGLEPGFAMTARSPACIRPTH